MIRSRQRASEDISSLSGLSADFSTNFPVIAPGKGVDSLPSFIIKSMRTVFTPMRAFAFSKAALFSAFVAATIAGKVWANYTVSKLAIYFVIADPTIGQILVLATTVVALGFFNLRALAITARTRDDARQVLLSILESPDIPIDLKRDALNKLAE